MITTYEYGIYDETKNSMTKVVYNHFFGALTILPYTPVNP